MNTRFSKIHGLGNDFIVIDETEKESVKDKKAFSARCCDRHKGIGADGVLFIGKSKKADFRMRVFNADGSEAENCINGIRCSALFMFLKNKGRKKNYRAEALAGINELSVAEAKGNKALVELNFLGKVRVGEKKRIKVENSEFGYYPVNAGNPHAVFFISGAVAGFDVEGIGHKIEYHPDFAPSRANAEFVNAKGRNLAEMRVHERGACETKACGSGSIAIAAAGIKAGLFNENEWIEIRQPGGSLYVKISGGRAMLKGEAEKAFEGAVYVV